MTPFATPTAPGALPVLGHIPSMLRRPLPFLSSLPAAGDLVQIRFGPRRVYVVCSPELTLQVLRDDRTFDKGGLFFERARTWAGNGLGTCPHRDHRRQRRLVQPAFHPDRLPAYARIMTEQITAVTNSWQQHRPVDVLTDMQTIAAHTLISTMFSGVVLGAADLTDIITDLNTIQSRGFRQMFLPPWILRLPLPDNRRYQQANTRLRCHLGRIVTHHRRVGSDHGDLLSALLATRDPDTHGPADQSLSDTELADQLVTFAFAGTETTASLTAWALHLLARHPDIQEKLHHETHRALTGPAAAFEDLPRLEYAGRVVTETMRLYPPGWLLTRITTGESDLAGHRIPAGASIVYSPYLIHHRRDLYPDPECFDPDRWKASGTCPTRGALLPFGGGARKCIGDTFATIEATLTIATIAAHWRLAPAPGADVRPAIGATLTPKGLRLLPTPREPRQ